MTIVRIDAEARWSDVVIHNNTLYYTGVPENLDADAFEQTANTLAQIDAVLEKQGSNKSSILDATIFLADKNDFAAMNKAWDAWVVAGHAPVRCTVQALSLIYISDPTILDFISYDFFCLIKIKNN
ncbi:RidA family protein [Escherichia coli]|uniref:RidA family protein n=1 Tax=Escherichia coli TaxID=562 RepID=UPI0020232F37|nr:RidA family protein [Escherichia coli]